MCHVHTEQKREDIDVSSLPPGAEALLKRCVSSSVRRHQDMRDFAELVEAVTLDLEDNQVSLWKSLRRGEALTENEQAYYDAFADGTITTAMIEALTRACIQSSWGTE